MTRGREGAAYGSSIKERIGQVCRRCTIKCTDVNRRGRQGMSTAAINHLNISTPQATKGINYQETVYNWKFQIQEKTVTGIAKAFDRLFVKVKRREKSI